MGFFRSKPSATGEHTGEDIARQLRAGTLSPVRCKDARGVLQCGGGDAADGAAGDGQGRGDARGVVWSSGRAAG